MKYSDAGTSVPHPFPYQGSKRNIAHRILSYFPADTSCLVEPFCGSAAVTIAAAARGLSPKFYINDLNGPLMSLWETILGQPTRLADDYARLWDEQRLNRKKFFFEIRDEFNRSHKPEHLLYLLARIVKGSVRYNSEGLFNQSADNRRPGMNPVTMRRQILRVSLLLKHKTVISSLDFREAVFKAGERSLIYMDPPYQGTSFTRDHRYCSGLAYDDFVNTLHVLNDNHVSYIVSYDGHTGNKTHGKPLPRHLRLKHLNIHAGRSSQATLLGGKDETVESLYLSPALIQRLNKERINSTVPSYTQQRLSAV